MANLPTDPKNCPHGHARRRKCDICDREDDHQEIERLASDSRELIEERDALTQKVCELITQRQQAQHERDCAVEKLAELREQFVQVADVMEKDGRFPTTVKAIRATVDVPAEPKPPHTHVWGPCEDRMVAVCECGVKSGEWYCPDSPDHLCHYSKSLDSCDYCGDPEERK